jgi:hypothetical protein
VCQLDGRQLARLRAALEAVPAAAWRTRTGAKFEASGGDRAYVCFEEKPGRPLDPNRHEDQTMAFGQLLLNLCT